MLFSSVSFLYVFLPAVLLCYALARGRWKNHVLLLFSLLFYAAGEPVYIVLLLFTAAVDYALALVVERYAGKRRARAALVLALVSNLLMLAFSSMRISSSARSTACSARASRCCASRCRWASASSRSRR